VYGVAGHSSKSGHGNSCGVDRPLQRVVPFHWDSPTSTAVCVPPSCSSQSGPTG